MENEIVYPLESFVFYRSFRDAIEEMDDSEKLATLLAICDYALYGVEPKLDGVMSRAVFTVAKPSIDANKTKRKNGKNGGRPKKETAGFSKENQRFSKSESTDTETDTETESETDTDTGTNKADKPPRAQFVVPRVEEVQAYIDEKGYTGIDAAAFVDYYTANGWMVGKHKMKDWKAAVRNWARREKKDDSRMELVTNEDGTQTWRMKT